MLPLVDGPLNALTLLPRAIRYDWLRRFELLSAAASFVSLYSNTMGMKAA